MHMAVIFETGADLVYFLYFIIIIIMNFQSKDFDMFVGVVAHHYQAYVGWCCVTTPTDIVRVH